MKTITLIRKKYDVTILLIEHDMKLVAGICEKIFVLNFGTELANGLPGDVLNNPEVVKAYLGE
jgi:branched-chain amino acid transport system ATP-binding protein